MTFLESYIETALWSSTDEKGTPLDDSKYSEAELTSAARVRMAIDCDLFIEKSAPIIEGYALSFTQMAHDFWLTRNRHGAGFWDGDYPESIGKQLTDLAHSFGECDLYIGDDGQIYIM